jgi:alpha-galactosidase/6-phospho-beta-glucosidase family protein
VAKIVFIGAGSLGFTRGLVRDVLTFPLLENAEIALVDINRERLDFAERACKKIVAMLTNLNAQIEMLVVEGSLRGDPELVYQAVAHDPLTASKLSLAEIRKMVNEMFRKNKAHLPQFKLKNLRK